MSGMRPMPSMSSVLSQYSGASVANVHWPSIRRLALSIRLIPLLAIPIVCSILLALYAVLDLPTVSLHDVKWAFAPLRLQYSRPNPCNPYTKPGMLHFNYGQPHLTTYNVFDPQCQPNNTFLHALIDGRTVGSLQHASVLIIGDSVDRGLIIYMCDAAKGGVLSVTTMNDSTIALPDDSNNGFPKHCKIESFDLDISFYHFCGLERTNMWGDKWDPCNPPGDLGSRWELFTSWAPTLARQPDLIIVQSALWDLAAFDRNLYITEADSTDLPGFTDAFIATWIDEMTGFVRGVKGLFPDSHIQYRIMHQVNENGGRWFRPEGYTADHGPAFRPLRVHQLREAQRFVVEQEGLDVLPLGDVIRFQPGALKDDIHPSPLGNALYAEMILEGLDRTRY